MRLSPRLLPLLLALGAMSHGATRVDVYNTEDMAARDINKEYEMVLHADISLLLPDNASCFYHSSDYVFTSAYTNAPINLSFYGEGDERGELLHNCAATFRYLGDVSFTNWVNTWGGDNDDALITAHGGAISADTGSVLFENNSTVRFSGITYDSSEWGANHSNISVHGGAIHALGQVQFTSNTGVVLQHISLINEHDTNYCYENFFSYGGAIYTQTLGISDTAGEVSISNNTIHQGICTDVEGEGKGAGLFITKSLLIEGTHDDVQLNGNSIHIANTALGGAVYLQSESTSNISGNHGHVELKENSVEAAPDMDFSNWEDSLEAACEARGGAIYVGGEFRMESNGGNITLEANKATANYSKAANSGDNHDNDPAYAQGGAIFLENGAKLFICNNGKENSADTGNVTFSGNAVSTSGTSGGLAQGGAVYLSSASTVEIRDNAGEIKFSGNAATEGGALYVSANSSVSIAHNTAVVFENNSATYGAAIYAADDVTISGNGNVLFSGNDGHTGSAIYTTNSSLVDICNNTGEVKFTGNKTANNSAFNTGAIHLSNGATLRLRNNAAVILETTEDARILYGESGSAAHISGNAAVNITGQETTKTSIIQTSGSLYIHDNTGTIQLNNNAALESSGGVFTLNGESALLSIHGNTGGITATGNYSTESGSVIYAEGRALISICDNTDITISSNSSRSGAAAIDTAGAIHIRNNTGSVIFSDNGIYDETSDSYTMRSIRANNAQFSAATGYSIEFRDSITIFPSSENSQALVLNADYTDTSATTHKQGGDIIFSGATTDNEDINIDQESSRRSRIDGDITLHNGRLIVTKGAELISNSLLTTANSSATVVLSQGGYLNQLDVNIATGTTLQAGDADTAILLAGTPMIVETLEQLIENTSVCGRFGGSNLTLQSGSAYTMCGGILDLYGGAVFFDADSAAITLSSALTPTLMDGESVLLLFCGVNHMEYSGEILFSYNGNNYGSEHLVYDAKHSIVYLRNLLPEPSTTLLSLFGLTALALRRRR